MLLSPTGSCLLIVSDFLVNPLLEPSWRGEKARPETSRLWHFVSSPDDFWDLVESFENSS
jgi:hypothetical protein